MTPIERLNWLTLVAAVIVGHGPSMVVAVLLADAARVDDSGTLCWIGVQGMMARTGLKHDAIIGGIKRLELLGAVAVQRRTGHSNVYRLTNPNQSVQADSVQSAEPVGLERLGADRPVGLERRTSRSRAVNQSVQADSNMVEQGKNMVDRTADADPATKLRAKFVQPGLAEIQSYCEERGNRVDAEKFLSHYESNGWKVGKNAMKDWRAAVRTWEKNDRNTKPVCPYEPNSQAWMDWYMTHPEQMAQ